MNYYVQLLRTPYITKDKNGKGLFAAIYFKKGETILELKGKFLTLEQEAASGGTIVNNSFRFSKNKYLSPQGESGNYLNHSCEPNARVIKLNNVLYLKALEDISPHDEITIDYSSIIADDDNWEMLCNCGSSSCRKVIGKFSLLPKEIQATYITSGIVPDYIRNISQAQSLECD